MCFAGTASGGEGDEGRNLGFIDAWEVWLRQARSVEVKEEDGLATIRALIAGRLSLAARNFDLQEQDIAHLFVIGFSYASVVRPDR